MGGGALSKTLAQKEGNACRPSGVGYLREVWPCGVWRR